MASWEWSTVPEYVRTIKSIVFSSNKIYIIESFSSCIFGSSEEKCFTLLVNIISSLWDGQYFNSIRPQYIVFAFHKILFGEELDVESSAYMSAISLAKYVLACGLFIWKKDKEHRKKLIWEMETSPSCLIIADQHLPYTLE